MSLQQNIIAQELSNNEEFIVNWLKKFLGDNETAMDVKQSAFLHVWEFSKHSKINNPKALMFKIARNLAYNEIRRRKRFDASFVTTSDYSEYEIEHATYSTTPSPEQITSLRDDIQRVFEEIDTLPERPKQTLIMHRIHGKSYKEIAQILSVSESSVEKYMIEALKRLRKCLTPDQDQEATIVYFQPAPGRQRKVS